MASTLISQRRSAPDSNRRARPRPPTKLPPAIVVDGGANALAIARSLGRRGVKVHAINQPEAIVRYSRHARWIPMPGGGESADAWMDFLLGPASDHLRGAVLLAAGDTALHAFARHREELAERYLLDDANPAAQMCMLDKTSTYRAARTAGVDTPRFWFAGGAEQIENLRSELAFPLIVKPAISHVFEQRFGCKFYVAESFDGLLDAWRVVCDARIDVMLVELIPGMDDRLCSYYTYLDERGEPLFDFTKRIIRRHPPGMGGACYHVTDWVPEVREPSMKLLRAVGVRGLANVEFKLDERDGRLKLIECNARFTAANCLVESAGFDLAGFVYNRLVGLPQAPLTTFREGVRLWYPIEDFKAFRLLRREGRITLGQWIASLCHRQTLPYFRLGDPMPTITDQFRRVRRKLWPC